MVVRLASGSRFASGPTGLDESLQRELDGLVTSAATSGVPWLDAELGRLLRRPGKRIRPGLVLASARCGPILDLSTALTCAAAIELLHRSTLVHDDLMDGAKFRGGEPTLHHTSGVAGALLGGDYLFGVGGRLIVQVGQEAAAVWHEAYLDLCDGQARETANRYLTITDEEYLRVIRGKTGSLIRAACELGALCSGLPVAGVRALARFGDCFGIVFQLVDDLLDVVSTPALCGKPVRHDAAQGVYTPPLLLAARRDGVALGPDLPPERIAALYRTALEHGVTPTVAAAYDWADRARVALSALPASPAREGLAELPEQHVTEALATRVAPEHRHLVATLIRRGEPVALA
ncbi:polyprenyl-diphosphate synthase GrcC [Rugosimonospora acidiphila]|uniref:Polyprenyl-diphosphate synthase GrcC n=1 Tax=Rugosimonospora acidiphila TaxID=556531 RepID=A0ABP9RNQ6_9ACTN